MCIIVYKPKSKNISKKILKNCWESNPDSAGFMFASGGILQIHKGFMEFKDFNKDFRECERQFNENYVLHFRIATDGGISKDNSHPFYINDSIGFAHNGILSCMNTPKASTKSDTALFCELVLQKLPANFLELKEYHILLESTADSENSKFTFLTNEGLCYIFAEEEGVWDKGIWYSNDGFKDDYGCVWKPYKGWKYSRGAVNLADGYVECVWCGDYIPENESCNSQYEPCCEACAAELESEFYGYKHLV